MRRIGPVGHFFECPRWHDGRWWVSDFFGHRVLAVTPDGDSEVVLELDDQPGGLGWLPDGRLLVVSMTRARVLRYDGVSPELHADLRALIRGHANDLLADGRGGAYVGSFGFDLTRPGARTVAADLVYVPPEGPPRVVADGLHFPNAMALTAGGELIVNETFASRHTAFTVRPDGGLNGRRVWAQPAPPPPDLDHALDGLAYGPDGSCLDADGALWVADGFGSAVVRVEEGVGITATIELPDGLHPFACALGGEHGRTLLVTAAPSFGPERRSVSTESVLFTVELG